ncbi:MAG: 2-oxo acid dehydrogenase subunit E2 [Pirellulaceae bacterium]
MTIEIKVPVLGEGVESGDVLDVFVSEGDVISKDDGIVELETDKATVTVPAEQGGKVVSVNVKAGDTVSVGQILVTLEGEGAGGSVAPAKPAPAEAKAEPAKPAPSASAPTNLTPTPAPEPAKPANVQPAPAPVTVSAPAPTLSTATADLAMIPAGPSMRRFAREVGVDLRGVSGTGTHGRITRDDILSVVRSGNVRSAVGATASAPATSSAAIPAVAPDATSDAYGSIRVEKMSKIRATIAQKMHESWSTVPRVTNFDDADVTDLEQIRQNNKKDYEARGIKLTTMPFLVKAVAMSLKAHPAINATIDMNNRQIVYKDYVNVGIAVDTDRGLVVPSLRNADKLAIPDIARNLHEVATNVRDGKFGVDDLRGGTFTISNLGAIGGTYSTPIINVPETAILLVGRSRKMPVVVGDQVVVRLMMPLSLSYDHRLIDGATAARFLNDVIGYLEAPSRLLLAL